MENICNSHLPVEDKDLAALENLHGDVDVWWLMYGESLPGLDVLRKTLLTIGRLDRLPTKYEFTLMQAIREKIRRYISIRGSSAYMSHWDK